MKFQGFVTSILSPSLFPYVPPPKELSPYPVLIFRGRINGQIPLSYCDAGFVSSQRGAFSIFLPDLSLPEIQ